MGRVGGVLAVILCAAIETVAGSDPSDERLALLIVRSLAPWQEPLAPELEANSRWFCESASAVRCEYRIWRTLPPGREEFHPWFSRFHLAQVALAEHPTRVDVVLWIDDDGVFFRPISEVEPMLAVLASRLASTPLILEPLGELADSTHSPKVYFASNSTLSRTILRALSNLVPREDRPFPPGAVRGQVGHLLHAYAYSGETRAQQYGTAGQLELLARFSAELMAGIEVAKQGSSVVRKPPLPPPPGQPDSTEADEGCTLPAGGLAESYLTELRAIAGVHPVAAPFVVHLDCGGEQRLKMAQLAALLASLNRRLGAAPLSAADDAAGPGGSVLQQIETLRLLQSGPQSGQSGQSGPELAPERVALVQNLPLAGTPTLLLIVYGEDFALQRTPVFVRSLLAARSTPLRLYVLGDPPGIVGFRRVLEEHGRRTGLLWAADSVSMFTADASRLVSALPSQLDPSCHGNGYGYLFYKLFAHELLPDADHLLVIDSDAIVLGDVAQLWAHFGRFGPSALVGMAPDQSHRYYYRLSDETDEVYSPGWRNVPQRTGVNGGLMLLHLARLRSLEWTRFVISSTENGAKMRDADELRGFCSLAEQDAINLIFAWSPGLWQPVECAWNYMATTVGGHSVVTLEMPGDGAAAGGGGGGEAAPSTQLFYDQCETGGPLGAYNAPGGDLVRCACGRRVEVLHFAGGTRSSRLRVSLNASIVGADPAELVRQARARQSQPLFVHELAADAARPGGTGSGAAGGAAQAEGALSQGTSAGTRLSELSSELSIDADERCVDESRCPDPCLMRGNCPSPYLDLMS